MKKKVVFIISSSIGGGAQILLLDLVKYLHNRLSIMVFCPSGYLSEHLIYEGFYPVITEVNSRSIGKIHDMVSKWAGDDDYTINPLLFGAAYFVCKEFHKDKKSRIFSLLLNPIIRTDLPFYKKVAYRHIAKVIGKYSDSIGVGSPELKKEVITLTGQEPIYLENRVPNTQPPRKVFFDGGCPLKVCFVGRMSEQKRPDLFLDTAEITALKKANIEYYMAGEGHLLKLIEKGIKEKKLDSIVHLVGFQEKLYSFLNKMDVLLLTSEFENSPLIMLNAMNASLPIVCGDVKGVTHLVDNNINGIVTKDYTAQAFAFTLMELAGNPKFVEKLGQKAYEKALDDYSYERFTELYVSAIEGC